MLVNAVPLVPYPEICKIHILTSRYTTIQRKQPAHPRSTYTVQFLFNSTIVLDHIISRLLQAIHAPIRTLNVFERVITWVTHCLCERSRERMSAKFLFSRKTSQSCLDSVGYTNDKTPGYCTGRYFYSLTIFS